MTNLLLRKTGLAFDKNKTGNALMKGTISLVNIIDTKTNLAKLQRKKVAGGLESGLKHHAAIDVEQLIRQEFEISAYDTLRRKCNTLADHLEMVASHKECPTEIREDVFTIIWAADKAEVPEQLLVVKAQLAKKYGKSFIQKARKNDGGCVNKMVYEKLLYQDYPSAKLVEDHLKAIAEEMNISSPSVVKAVEKATNKLAVSDKAPASKETTPETRKPSPLQRLKEAPKETCLSPSDPTEIDAISEPKPSRVANPAKFSAEAAKAFMTAP